MKMMISKIGDYSATNLIRLHIMIPISFLYVSWFSFPEELGYLVDAIINSGEISTFPGQQVMINHKITIQDIDKINDKEENILLLDIQIYISECYLVEGATKTMTIKMRNTLTNTKTKIFTSFVL